MNVPPNHPDIHPTTFTEVFLFPPISGFKMGQKLSWQICLPQQIVGSLNQTRRCCLVFFVLFKNAVLNAFKSRSFSFSSGPNACVVHEKGSRHELNWAFGWSNLFQRVLGFAFDKWCQRSSFYVTPKRHWLTLAWPKAVGWISKRLCKKCPLISQWTSNTPLSIFRVPKDRPWGIQNQGGGIRSSFKRPENQMFRSNIVPYQVEIWRSVCLTRKVRPFFPF